MKHPRIVFDTNIFISAILFGGNPRQCLELAKEGKIELLSSKAIILEVAINLRKKFLWEDSEVNEILEGLLIFTTIVTPAKKVKVIKYEKDNRILECAWEAKADFIVSGDKKHLLSLAKFEDINIVSAKEFLDLVFDKKIN